MALTKAEQNRDLTRKGRLTISGTESVIRAPAAGTILTRTVNPGDPIVPLTSYQPGTEMATIADMCVTVALLVCTRRDATSRTPRNRVTPETAMKDVLKQLARDLKAEKLRTS